MSNLLQGHDGLTRAWDTITIGWRELRGAAARYRHGVLSVSLPKTATPRGRRIAVELH